MATHARPPDDRPDDGDAIPPGTVEGSISEIVESGMTPDLAARAQPGRKRRPRVFLPDDDPFVLIGMIDETGGAMGNGEKPMNATQMKAFRVLCMMPPTHRSLVRLGAKLEIEWGRAPNRKSLEAWSSKFAWQKLLKVYDEQLDRYTLFKLEQDRSEARRRQANTGRALQRLAAAAATDEIAGADEGEEPRINPRTGKPYVKRGNRVQGLAFLYKVGVETERLALGLPSTITDQKVQTDNRNQNVTVNLSLDEWRRASRQSRFDPAAEPDGLPPVQEQRALPAPAPAPVPASDKPWLRDASVRPEDLEELPDTWFEAGAEPPARPAGRVRGPVVDADPNPPAKDTAP